MLILCVVHTGERDMSDSRIGAAAVETRETVDGKRCAIRYIIGEHQWLLG